MLDCTFICVSAFCISYLVDGGSTRLIEPRLAIATALGLELYDPEGRALDSLGGARVDMLAAPDANHLAVWINYGSHVRVYEVK